MGEVLVIASGKGGAGKSTLAVNLALALIARKKTVVLVDADTGLRSLDIMLGLQDRVVYDLCDAAEGLCRVRQALVRDRGREGLCLMAAAQTRESGAVAPAQMERVVGQLRAQFDYVIVDAPAGVGRGFRAAAAAADRAILVALPDWVSMRGAERVVGLLERQDILHPMLVVNRLADGASPSPNEMASALGISLLGLVPEERGVSRAMSTGKPEALIGTAAGRAYQNIARRLMGEAVPLPGTKPRGRIWQWLARYFGAGSV
ncbi:MAG: septum site-determining protein MinD [Clostridiales bacterium]|nr:septum site-determining protein MinD [Clostridiales bacterium]